MTNFIVGIIMVVLLVIVIVIVIGKIRKVLVEINERLIAMEQDMFVQHRNHDAAHQILGKTLSDGYESTMAGLQKILNSMDDQCGSRHHRILYTKLIELRNLLDMVLAKTPVFIATRDRTSEKTKKRAEKFLSGLQDMRKKSK